MPLYPDDRPGGRHYQEIAALPLPGPAIVIDVRHSDQHDVPLLWFLVTDLEDLAMEMRLNQVPRWRHLAECIDFVRLDATPPDVALHESTDFVLTTRTGKPIPIQGREDLTRLLGRDYLDRIRNHHIRAIKDNGPDAGGFAAEQVDPEQPTVRVFFLTDMEERESLTRAATYAQWLKEWAEESHSRRFNRDAGIHTLVICMNAHAPSYEDVLLPSLGQLPDTAIDSVVLLQMYSNDEAYIGGEAQIYQAELILYTLLLHWPEAFRMAMDDLHGISVTLVSGAVSLPWPTYTVGISALEYSARWAARWLDYGVAAKLLEILNDSQKVDQDDPFLQLNIQKWLNNWWQEIRATVPDAMTTTIEDLQVFDGLQKYITSPSFLRSTPGTSLQALETFCSQVSELYTGTSGMTLEHAMENSPLSILDYFKWIDRQTNRQGSDQDQIDEPYKKLARLYTKIRQFLPSHFQGAWGAFPRAVRQLSALTEHIQAVHHLEQHPPTLQECREHFERRAQEAHQKLESELKMWRLPFLGHVLRSTVISLFVVIIIGIVVLVGVSWQSLLSNLFSSPALSFLSLQAQDATVLSIKVVLVAILAGCELLYLSARNRSLRREKQRIHNELSQTVQAHFDAVGSVIAARVALALLQWADLYVPGESISPYEQRLRDFDRVLRAAHEQASSQQALADARLQLILGQAQSGPIPDLRWPGLNNRQDVLAWNQIEDAFLQSCKELKSDPASLNLLSEMLLRRLGTERATELVEDMLRKQRWLPQQSEEARFQAVSTMLTAVALSSETVHPEVTDVLSLLKQYVALKDLYLQGPAVPGSNGPDLPGIVKGTLLEQVLEHSTARRLSIQQNLPVASTLAAWVGREHHSTPPLTRIFDSNDVLDHLAEQEINVPLALDMLRRQSSLLGYPDEIAGDDYFYLLLASGEARRAFTRSLDQPRNAQVQPELFPDGEKLVYLHIHRIRQISAGASV